MLKLSDFNCCSKKKIQESIVAFNITFNFLNTTKLSFARLIMKYSCVITSEKRITLTGASN